MFNIFKKNKIKTAEPVSIRSLSSGPEIYTTNTNATESMMVGYSNSEFDFSIENIINRLTADVYIESAEFDEESGYLVVYTTYTGSSEKVLLRGFELSEEILKFTSSSSRIPNCNMGVSADMFQAVQKSPAYILSVMKFNARDPYASYKAQLYVLNIAIELEFVFDQSARKNFHPAYIEYILEQKLEYFSKNLFSVISLDNGWYYTIGLSRFYKKDLEFNHVSSSTSIYNLLELEGLKQLAIGTVADDQTIDLYNGCYLTYLDIETASKYLSEQFLGTAEFRGEEFMTDRQVLILTDRLDFTVSDLEQITINDKYQSGGLVAYPEVITNSIQQSIVETEEMFNQYIVETELYKHLSIKFSLETADNIEYIWAKIKDIKEGQFTVLLKKDSIYNTDLKVDSELTISYQQIVDWICGLDLPFPIAPYNLYVFKNTSFSEWLLNSEL